MGKGVNDNKKSLAASLGILQLAYVGDAVMELYTRNELLSHGNFPSGKLNKMAKGYVTCEAQSDAVERVTPYLTEEELAVYKRGRNAKTHFSPSHGELIQYRRATGFEALFGYLHMSGEEERAREIFSLAYEGVFEKMLEKIK